MAEELLNFRIKEIITKWKVPLIVFLFLLISYVPLVYWLPKLMVHSYFCIYPRQTLQQGTPVNEQASSTIFMSPGTTGPIGDTFGGTLGPFVALIAAFLTFLAFWIQYQANERQKEATDKQRKDIALERFENKFYELLRLHRANVEEMNIAERLKGRGCFIRMFYELEFTYKTVEEFYNKTPQEEKNNLKYSEIDLMDFAYTIFFFGTGVHSEKHYIKSFKAAQYQLYKKIKNEFLKPNVQDKYEEYMKQNNGAKYYTHSLPENGEPNEKTMEFYYYPLDGHVNRLGHYYRHLFQTASYVISQKFLTDEEKYDYIKTLRAQLSNFEQLLLYYNAIAWYDDEWRIIFTEFRLIKNLPLPLADFYSRPEKHFEKEINSLRKKGIEIFEWLEK